MQAIIQKLREITPLGLRQRIGPYIAYVVYVVNVYIRKKRRRPHVLSIEETLNLIAQNDLSVVRFGDGEMSSIANHDLPFQSKDEDLAKKLSIVLTSKHPGLLICIPGIFEKLSGFTKTSFWFSLHHLFKYGHLWNALLDSNQTYGDAFITRPYLTFKDKSKSEHVFKKMISLWENKDVILIEGSKSRLGVGNDIFSKAKSVGRILCPPENAYAKYESIKNQVLKADKEKLVLISLGPTAKVLAYDLFLLGYRVIDVGHIDMEYEMFLRREMNIVKVRYKYFNEIEERVPEECTDPEYLRQIITRIE